MLVNLPGNMHTCRLAAPHTSGRRSATASKGRFDSCRQLKHMTKMLDRVAETAVAAADLVQDLVDILTRAKEKMEKYRARSWTVYSQPWKHASEQVCSTTTCAAARGIPLCACECNRAALEHGSCVCITDVRCRAEMYVLLANLKLSCKHGLLDLHQKHVAQGFIKETAERLQALITVLVGDFQCALHSELEEGFGEMRKGFSTVQLGVNRLDRMSVHSESTAASTMPGKHQVNMQAYQAKVDEATADVVAVAEREIEQSRRQIRDEYSGCGLRQQVQRRFMPPPHLQVWSTAALTIRERHEALHFCTSCIRAPIRWEEHRHHYCTLDQSGKFAGACARVRCRHI